MGRDFDENKTRNSKGGQNAFAEFLQSLNFFARDSEKASDMAANIKIGATAVNNAIDSMYKGAKYLDGIWKGDTKETFIQELNELKKLIEANAKELENMGNTIEKQNRISDETQKESYNDALKLYNEQSN
jgi:hypothetical protein